MTTNAHNMTLERAHELLGTEGYGELLGYIDSVPFIATMISNDRPKVTDLPMDAKGRRIIDITNPPILENMDYFRQTGITFMKEGRYTHLYPNGNANSDYMQFWNEEMRRCKYGYVRESDGLWISGYNYWYWNFNPIMKTRQLGEVSESGTVKSERIYSLPDIWDGDFLYFHYVDQATEKGLHGAVLKSRGMGFSFKAGGMLIRNQFLFKKSNSYAMASMEEYLTNDGILNKAWDEKDFINDNTAWKKLFVVDKMMKKEVGYFDMDSQSTKGYRSTIYGVTVNKADKARGKRGMLALWEEAGSFPDLLKAWSIFRRSIEDGPNIFGTMIAFGTGGDQESSFEALEELFYSPKGYRVHNVPNVWDKNSSQSRCAYFAPAYLNRADAYDINGNSDVIKALVELIRNQLEVKYGASDPTALTQEKAELPITPQDAVLRTIGTIFPIADIKEYLIEIEPNRESFLANHKVGDLVYSGDSVKWRLTDHSPLRSYPIKESDKSGAIEVFSTPIKSEGGRPVAGRYVIGVDPVDADTGTSLFSAFVFDLFTDQIVAEFTGRRQTANENFEIVLKLAMWYNAKINYENNLKGMYAYFEHKNVLHYLMATPEILRDQQLVKVTTGFGNKGLGTPANKAVNTWARKMIADWMLTVADGQQDINLRRIRSIGLIKEALYWNPDGNFDRISAMGMVMVARAELYRQTESGKHGYKTINLLEDDEFLKLNKGIIIQIDL